MTGIDNYIARVEGTCGAEKDVIVTFKYDKRDEAIQRIFKNAKLKNTIAGIVFELVYKDVSFRVYKSGKAIFRNIKNKEELNGLLSSLLLQPVPVKPGD